MDRLHEKARAALHSRIAEALNTAQLSDGRLAAWRDSFDAVRDQILKYRGEWLESSDINDAIVQIVALHLPESDQKHTGPISNWANEEILGNAALGLLAFFESIPRPYQIFFPLPRVRIPDQRDRCFRANVTDFGPTPEWTITMRNRVSG